VRTTLLSLIVSTLFLHAETPEVTDAAERAFRRADAELAATAKKLSAQLTDRVAREDFERAQTAWKKYCAAEASFRAALTSQGGSAYTTDLLSSRTDLTIERTKQLRKLIQSK
jgi:uncharacterized protein YecT (DUF1311 family)